MADHRLADLQEKRCILWHFVLLTLLPTGR